MARAIGSRNKRQAVPEAYGFTAEQRVQLLAALLIEIAIEEQSC